MGLIRNGFKAPPGAVKVEIVGRNWVNARIEAYTKHGWKLRSDPQTSKSFLRSAKVTLTFEKL